MTEPKKLQIWTDAEDDELCARIEAGDPYPDIARALGRTESAIRRRYSVINVNQPVRRRKTTEPEKEFHPAQLWLKAMLALHRREA